MKRIILSVILVLGLAATFSAAVMAASDSGTSGINIRVPQFLRIFLLDDITINSSDTWTGVGTAVISATDTEDFVVVSNSNNTGNVSVTSITQPGTDGIDIASANITLGSSFERGVTASTLSVTVSVDTSKVAFDAQDNTGAVEVTATVVF